MTPELCRRLLLVSGFFLVLLLRQSSGQITPPRIGLVRYGDGGVYPVYGVPGNYVIGERLLDAVNALSSSEAGALLDHHGKLLLLDARLTQIAAFDLAGDTAVTGVQASLQTAVAWLPVQHAFVHWNGQTMAVVPVPEGTVSGQVFSVAKPSVDTAILLSRTAEGTVVEYSFALPAGRLISRAVRPGLAGLIYDRGTAFLSVESGQLVLTSRITGTRKVVASRIDEGWFERVSESCVHLHGNSSGRDWLLQLWGDSAAAFELPAAPMAHEAGR